MRVWIRFFQAGVAALLLACSTNPEEDLPRLEFPSSMPAALGVGDTTGFLVMTRVTLSATGRESPEPGYRDFTFTSSNPAVVAVVDERRLVGLAAGEASITAEDKAGSARTKSGATVKVTAE